MATTPSRWHAAGGTTVRAGSTSSTSTGRAPARPCKRTSSRASAARSTCRCRSAEGWTVAATDLAATLAARGATAIVYTDIARDGTEQGPNVEETAKVARAAKIPVVASGGVGSLAHVRAVQARTADGIEGLIIGR